jgi:hypothetical protein
VLLRFILKHCINSYCINVWQVLQKFRLIFINPLPHIDVFWRLFDLPPFFEASNSEKLSYLDPKQCFSFEKCCLKKWSLFRRRLPPKWYIKGLPEGGSDPFCLGVWRRVAVSLIAKKILNMWQVKNGLKSV